MARPTVYELDRAETQEAKQQRMRKAGIPIPERPRYATADLNAETLYDALSHTDFDCTRPALCSRFGVTYHLGRDVIRQTLESIAAEMPPGRR